MQVLMVLMAMLLPQPPSVASAHCHHCHDHRSRCLPQHHDHNAYDHQDHHLFAKVESVQCHTTTCSITPATTRTNISEAANYIYSSNGDNEEDHDDSEYHIDKNAANDDEDDDYDSDYEDGNNNECNVFCKCINRAKK